jgi:dephospho-CoA kinase
MVCLIGLTGQSGAGKTTACKVFSECGFAVIDADECSRAVVEPGSPCLKELTEYFGIEILKDDGSLNRSLLADKAFSDKRELKKMNAIMYPFITELICARIKDYKNRGFEYIMLDAPTLFESKADELCDLIISVTAKEDIRKKRVIERDGLNEESASRRLSAQHTERYFIEHSDFIIKNNKSLSEMTDKVREVAEKVKDYFHHQQISELKSSVK